MTNTSGEHRPRRLLKYSAILLVVAQLAYAGYLAVESRHEVRNEQAALLATVADLDASAVDSYFSQLEIGMRNLGAELTDTQRKRDLGRAYGLVHRFQKLHTELGNVILMRGDGRMLLTGNEPNNPDMPTLAGDPVFMKFRDELQQGRAVRDRPAVGGQYRQTLGRCRALCGERPGRQAGLHHQRQSAGRPVAALLGRHGRSPRFPRWGWCAMTATWSATIPNRMRRARIFSMANPGRMP